MFLRAARSMAAFVGWCDGGSTDDGCAAASMDETTIRALHLLHQHEYDTGKALQALVKVINPKSVDKRWSDDDAKKFVRGLKQHGKNFFKIRRDMLLNKEVSQLIEYYYLWKKTPAASTTRPHRRHRRPALKRQVPTPTVPSNEELEDMSSTSEPLSENESDEENDPLVANTCCDCCTTKSMTWYERGKDGHVVCAGCVRKYNISGVNGDSGDAGGGDSHQTHGAVGAELHEPPPFMFRPVKEEEQDWKHDVAKDDGIDTNGKHVDHEGRTTTPSCDSSCCASVASLAENGKDTEGADTSTVNVRPQAVKLGPVSDSNVGPLQDAVRSTASPREVVSIASVGGSFSSPNDGNTEMRTCEVTSGSAFTRHGQLPETGNFVISGSHVSSNMDQLPDSTDGHGLPPDGDPGSVRDLAMEPPPAWYPFAPGQMNPFEALNAAFGTKSTEQLQSLSPAPAKYRSPAKYRPATPPQIKTEPPLPLSSVAPYDSRLLPPPPGVEPGKWLNHGIPPMWDSGGGDGVGSGEDPDSGRMLHGGDFDNGRPLRAVASIVPTQNLRFDDGNIAGSDTGRQMAMFQCPPPLVPLRSPPPMGDISSGNFSYDGGDRRLDSRVPFSSGRASPLLVKQCSTSRSPNADADDGNNSESDSDYYQQPRGPSPEPQPINIEVYRSRNAIFVKRWNRGYNSCSRSDLQFIPPPDSTLVRRREERAAAKSAHAAVGSGAGSRQGPSDSRSGSAAVSVVKDGRKMDAHKPRGDIDEKKKQITPPENRSSDAQITSSLMSSGHHLQMFGPPEQLTPRGGGGTGQFPMGHDPTPALRQLSEYARPHIGGSAGNAPQGGGGRDLQRGMQPYGLPPGHAMDPFFRMPGVFPPGSREALELEMERDKREREAWEREIRDIRELEFMEKMKQEMDLKIPGFDRLGAAAAAGQLDPMWIAELQRRYVTSGGPPPPPGHMPGGFPPSGNLAADLMQRERERIEMARSSQEQQQQQQLAAALAARDNGALFQLYQWYAHDPATLQRQLSAFLAMSASKAHDNEVARMMDASHLVYHFARADPMSGAGPSAAQGGPPNLGPPPMSAQPPPQVTPHGMPPPGSMAGHPLIAAAREQERLYMELMSRPPYSTDPMLAQQLMVQAAAQQEAIQRQLAMERECLGGGPGGPMLH